MKRGALLLISLFLLLSCSREKEPTPPEKWRLMARAPHGIGEELVLNDIPHQYYLFYENQTFSKHQEEEETLEATGTFEVIEEDEGKRYVLTYDESHPLIENCSDDNKEHLYFMREDAMANVSCTSENGSATIYLLVMED